MRRKRTRPRNLLSATARGYGYDHVKLRAALIAQWTPGDPCTRCDQPMWGPPRKIHLAHKPDRSGYEGLQHERCNESEAAVRLNAMQRERMMVQHSRNW